MSPVWATIVSIWKKEEENGFGEAVCCGFHDWNADATLALGLKFVQLNREQLFLQDELMENTS